MIAYRKPQIHANSPVTFVELEDEVEEVLESWVEETYQDLIDKTEYLDSSRVKRID